MPLANNPFNVPNYYCVLNEVHLQNTSSNQLLQHRYQKSTK